jgi:nucleoside-diphosphate-sugar epimerase
LRSKQEVTSIASVEHFFFEHIDGLKGEVINIGNPHECTILEFAERVIALTGSSSDIIHRPLPTDDPTRRRPDITKARRLLEWEPEVSLDDGLTRTLAYFRASLVPAA